MKLLSATLLFSAATVGVSMANAVDVSLEKQEQQLEQEPPTRALRSEVQAVSPGAVGDATIASFQIAQALAPLMGDMFKKKKCHQLACWIAVPNESCGMTAANQVQRELTKGRNSFSVESVGETGMWVRYWRTQFSPPDQGDIADGECASGVKFVVTNCQQTGKVYC